MSELTTGNVTKGDICWFTMSITRGKEGLVVYVKVDPRIESFMASLGAGQKELAETYGAEWYPIGEKPLEVYSLFRDIKQSGNYTISVPGSSFTFRDKKTGDEKINLAFLRLVGIGSPEGVTFGMAGPFSRDYIRDIQTSVPKQVKSLIQEYVLPVNINLRISSQEV